jgi:hypothetical protein
MQLPLPMPSSADRIHTFVPQPGAIPHPLHWPLLVPRRQLFDSQTPLLLHPRPPLLVPQLHLHLPKTLLQTRRLYRVLKMLLQVLAHL